MSGLFTINHVYHRLIVDNSSAINTNLLQIFMNIQKAFIDTSVSYLTTKIWQFFSLFKQPLQQHTTKGESKIGKYSTNS